MERIKVGLGKQNERLEKLREGKPELGRGKEQRRQSQKDKDLG